MMFGNYCSWDKIKLLEEKRFDQFKNCQKDKDATATAELYIKYVRTFLISFKCFINVPLQVSQVI